jgi:hypothetical protein
MDFEKHEKSLKRDKRAIMTRFYDLWSIISGRLNLFSMIYVPHLCHIWGKSDPPGYPVGVLVPEKGHLGSGKMSHLNLDEKNGC